MLVDYLIRGVNDPCLAKVGQIMLYVNNQDESLAFWTEVAGFHIVDEVNLDEGMRWIEISPTPDSQTSIILHDKEFVARMSAGVNLGTPSLCSSLKIWINYMPTI
jgi:lactoylglutathione lyase